MAQRISGKDLPKGGNKIRVVGGPPARLVDNVFRANFSLNRLIAPTVLDLQKSEGRKIARQAIVDGQNGRLDPKLLFNPSFRGQAYTNNALDGYTKNLELNTRLETNRILNDNRMDSKKAKALLDSYIQGQIEGMPRELQERMGPQYKLQSDILANAGLSKIRAGENTRRLKQKQAVDQALDIERAKNTPLIGAGLGSDDFTVKVQSVLAYQQQKSQIEGAYSSTLADGEVEIPVYSESDKVTAIAEFNQIVGRSMISEQFRNVNDKAGYLRDFRQGKLEESFYLRDDEGNQIADLRPDPKTRAALDKGMQAAINSENAQIKKQQTAVKTSITNYVNGIKNNIPFTDDQEIELRQGASQFGTPAQIERLDSWINHRHEIDDLRTKTPAQIQNAVISLNNEIQELKANGEIVSPGMVERLDMVAKLKKEKEALLFSDPIAAGIEYGDIDNTGPLDSPEKMTTQAANARIVSEKYGLPLKILTANNKKRFKTALQNPELTADGLGGLLGMFDGFGADKFQALMELSPDHPELAHIAALRDYGPSNETDNALRGYLLQKRDDIKIFIPSQATRKAEANTLGDGFRMHPKTGEAVVKTARAIYTAMAFDAGMRGEEFKEELYKKALMQASGGRDYGDGPLGGLLEFDDHMVLVPQNVSHDDFEDNMDDFTAADFEAGGINGGPIVSDIGTGGTIFSKQGDGRQALDESDAFLVSIGEGLYHIATEDGNGKINFLRGRQDLNSNNPGVRNGFYVLDYSKALESKQERERQKAAEFKNEGQVVSETAEGVKQFVQETGDKLGSFGDQLYEKGKAALSDDSTVDQPLPEDSGSDLPSAYQSAIEKLKAIKIDIPSPKIEIPDVSGLEGDINKITDFSGKSAAALGDLAAQGKEKVLQGSAQVTKTIIKEVEKTKKALDEVVKEVENVDFKKAAKKKGKSAVNNLKELGDELGEDILGALSGITRGVMEAGDAIKSGVETVKEFAEKNIQEAKILSKLVTKKARKLSNEESVRVFAKTIAPMIIRRGSAEGLPAPENVITALVSVESSFRANQVSPQGAKGPTQIMPATAQEIADDSNLGYTKDEILNDPEKNIMAGMYYLFEKLLPRYRGPDRLRFAVAAYHGGLGNIDKARAKVTHKNDFKAVYPKLGPKTQAYVDKVFKRMRVS